MRFVWYILYVGECICTIGTMLLLGIESDRSLEELLRYER